MAERLLKNVYAYFKQTEVPQHSREIENLPANNEPFIIRGHHLKEYMILVKYNAPPKESADFLVSKYKFEIEELDQMMNPFAVDTVGSSKRQLNQFGLNVQDLFQIFNALPENYPVEIVEGLKDSICTHCVTGKGKHCSIKYINDSNASVNNINGDGKYLDKFWDLSVQLGLNDQVSIEDQEAKFTDSDPEKVRVFKTQMSTVRAVLNSWEIEYNKNTGYLWE